MIRESNRSFGAALVTAILAGIAGFAGSYALAGYTQKFVAAPIASFVTHTVPGFVPQFAIGTLTDIDQQFGISHLGQKLNFLLALTIGTLIFAILTFVALTIGRRLDNRFVSVGLTGVLVWLAAMVITGAPMVAVGTGVGSAIVVAVAMSAVRAGESTGSSVSHGRREVLGSPASAIGVGVVGYLLGTRDTQQTTQTTRAAAVDTTGETNDAGDATGNVPDGANSDPLNGKKMDNDLWDGRAHVPAAR